MTAPFRCCTARRRPDLALRRAHLALTERADNHPLGAAALRGPEPLRAAAATASRWAVGRTITVAFLPGSIDSLMREAQRAAKRWTSRGLIDVAFVGPSAKRADCRVSTALDGTSWSLVGTDCLLEDDQSRPTMNLGWLDDYPRTLHEFGHLFGLEHEHQLPDRTLRFVPAATYAYFEGPPNDWPKDEVDSQVLNVDREPLTSGGFDVRSIMEYWFPASLLDPPTEIPRVEDLSARDEAFFGLTLYPGRWSPPAPTSVPPAPPPPAVTPPPNPPEPPPVNPSIASVKSSLLSLLSWVPGEVSKEVNLSAFGNAVLQAELADPLPLTYAHLASVAAHAVVRQAATVFPDPGFRAMAVALLETAYGPAS